jgi:hypothetical protein
MLKLLSKVLSGIAIGSGSDAAKEKLDVVAIFVSAARRSWLSRYLFPRCIDNIPMTPLSAGVLHHMAGLVPNSE